MRRAVVFGLTWLTVFMAIFLGAEAALVILEEQKPTSVGPVMIDRSIIHWDFDVKGNYTRTETWDIEFDDLFPGDSREYTVFPEFFAMEQWEMGGSVGEFEVWVYMYLNDVFRYGFERVFVMEGPGGAGYSQWYCGEDYMDEFSNATPKASDNIFEVRLSFWSNMSTFGDGWIDIIAGPLLLYANLLPASNHLLVVLPVSAILALPTACVTMALSRGVREEAPQKRRIR